MVARHPRSTASVSEDAYDIIALRNIERIERPPSSTE
jgi:hypothetical protein